MNRSYTELPDALIGRVYRRHAGAKVLFFPEKDIGQARFFSKKGSKVQESWEELEVRNQKLGVVCNLERPE